MAIYTCHLLLLTFFAGLGAGQDECSETSCRDNGPAIRFPFRLKDHQPDRCGYPGFDLSCSQSNDTLLHLPFSAKVSVQKINYKSQSVHVNDPDGCLLLQLTNLNYSAFHLQLQDNYYYNYTLFNCTSTQRASLIPISCLSSPGYQVYAAYSIDFISDLPLLSCSKMYEIFSFPSGIFGKKFDVPLNWSKPICGHCEEQGKYCRLKNNSTQHEAECFDIPKQPNTGASSKLKVAGEVLGPFLMLLISIAIYCVHTSNKLKKEDEMRIEKFLEDYKALKPTRYSYADIKKITNRFQDKLGQGGYGTVFKGKFSNEILVAVKVLNNLKGNGEEFINEVGTMGTIHHVNVVRLVGYCADGFRRALVYEFLPNDSLEKFIFSASTRNISLGWEKLQDIALGIAKGIEYLHQGCEQRILHFDIKPHNILLDQNFNPKISDFGLAKLYSKEQSAVSMTAARGTMGYIAPEVLSRNFGKVSYKSDVYSFGMLLLEIVGGRKNNDVTVENTSQVYFPEWIYNNLNQGEELRIRIEEDGDAKIARKLAIVGLWCIQWCPADRPSMKVVVQMLEGEGDNMTMPANPFATTSTTIRNNPGRHLQPELPVISEIE
ncbi:hypothetical protein F0562_030946 [Nyssa sinensis]|uniref:Protein kinase domain-containing protein n=1 Tax=Nyssa sinensis TaxID=561372 RepID=A0A5J5ASU6_9ASTE|nr:hypothetical protein F0562_030946 [Nyssa sinensis]